MSTTVTLKRSSVQGKVPQPSDLNYGEVALNFTDGRLYFRNSSDQIEFFETSSSEALSVFDILEDDLNLGLVTGSLDDTLDLGLVTESFDETYDLGDIAISGFIAPNTLLLSNHPSDSLPSPELTGRLIYVNNSLDYIEDGYVDDGYASGGDTIAFSDGEKWNQLSSVSITGDYSDLANTPDLSTVATSGAYNDLIGSPNLSDVAESGSYNDLTDTPSLSTVATTGSYNDLTNVPDLSGFATETYVDTAVSDLVSSAPETLDTLNELAEALDSDPNFATTITNELGLKADSSSLSAVATSGDYDDLTNKPPEGASTGKAIAMAIVFG